MVDFLDTGGYEGADPFDSLVTTGSGTAVIGGGLLDITPYAGTKAFATQSDNSAGNAYGEYEYVPGITSGGHYKLSTRLWLERNYDGAPLDPLLDDVQDIVRIIPSATTQGLFIRLQTDRKLSLVSGVPGFDGPYLGSTVLTSLQYNLVEFYADLGPTGYVQVFLNGSLEIEASNIATINADVSRLLIGNVSEAAATNILSIFIFLII